jgi:hypothetical protein
MSPGKSLARGPQGDQGTRGERGTQGERGRAVIVLFLIGALVGSGNLFWTAHEVSVFAAGQHRQNQATEAKFCMELGKLAALKPPPGDPVTNPARAYDQELHAGFAALGGSLGCAP